jgi:hypothetical protein
VSPTPESQRPGDEASHLGRSDELPSARHDKEARLFHERLEQTGQLVDVDANADVTKLPPHVTHVRYPDGTVERIGFSSSSYGP